MTTQLPANAIKTGTVTYRPSYETDSYVEVSWIVSKGFATFALSENSMNTAGIEIKTAGGVSVNFLSNRFDTLAHIRADKLDVMATEIVQSWINQAFEDGFIGFGQHEVICDGDLYQQIDEAIADICC